MESGVYLSFQEAVAMSELPRAICCSLLNSLGGERRLGFIYTLFFFFFFIRILFFRHRLNISIFLPILG